MSLRKILAIGALLLTGWVSLAAAGFAFPEANCILADDHSSIRVIASYPKDDISGPGVSKGPLNCQISCLVKASGEHLFSPFQCEFRLNPGAAEKIVCEQKGTGPGAYIVLRRQQLNCVPR